MTRRRRETTIERIYREVTGNKMPAAVKRVSSTQAKGQAALVLCSVEELRMPGDG